MITTRRDALKFAGGSALGILFTPAPWHLLRDTALWSENWPGIPRPARGEIRFKNTNCALCPAGCAVRARCVGDQPVSLAGTGSGLCPFGVTGHHLPYHPARLRQGPFKEAEAAVADAIAKCAPNEHIAILDLCPGRTASWTHRRAMAAIPHGVYLAPPRPSVAVDLSRARTVLSLGAPLYEGWGTPAKVFAARDHIRLIHADPIESRTAALADLWLPIRPGSESALILGLAGKLNPAEGASRTGLTESQIAAVAQELRTNGPALVIDPAMSPAAVSLNVELGAWGITVFPRRDPPVPAEWKKTAAARTEFDALPDRSIRALLIDESQPGDHLPWTDIQPKLAAGAVVVAFVWSRNGYARHAQYALPTAVYPEALTDIPPAIDSTDAKLRLSTPLISPPPGMVDPAVFITAAAGLAIGDPIKERAAAPAEPPTPQPPPAITYPALAQNPPAVLLAPSSPRLTLISPLMSKLYQESNLLLAPNQIAVHPGTLLEDGKPAILQTSEGRWNVTVLHDPSVPPGTILAARPEMAGQTGKVVPV